ncbi:hypothetical protein EDD17DRAFT_1665595 [Pisolithus thermaeus]|nr:hypothetical protein EDD17DRAFT_1665595 [Pisolithus thermaeus]
MSLVIQGNGHRSRPSNRCNAHVFAASFLEIHDPFPSPWLGPDAYLKCIAKCKCLVSRRVSTMHGDWYPIFTEFFSLLIKPPPSTSPSILLGTYIRSGLQKHVLFQDERRYLCIPFVAGDRYQCHWYRTSLPPPKSELHFCSGNVQTNRRRAYVKHRTQASVEGRTFDPAVGAARQTFF